MSYVSLPLLQWAIIRLHQWGSQVGAQKGAQLWPLLALKLKGAAAGTTIRYSEADDRDFFERFFRYRNDREPYFDPIAERWLKKKHYHSNAATMRKSTFIGSWGAGTWNDDNLTLDPDYFTIFASKVIVRRAQSIGIPALPMAVWMFKQLETWSDAPQLAASISSPTLIVQAFRTHFNFENLTEWTTLFDQSEAVPVDIEALFVDEPLTTDQISDLLNSLTRPENAISTVPTSKITNRTITITDLVTAAERERLVLPEVFLKRLLAALSVGHVRLIGAPGTGKSTIARMVLEQTAGDNFDFAAATTQWTGDDIIGGLMPDSKASNVLIFQPGLALRAAEANRWLCIDEINRADIDAAFGEFFSLLSGFDVTTPYQTQNSNPIKILAERPLGDLDDGVYGIPEDWRMIATMNSWDKLSLNRLSFAFSRRWCSVFVPIPEPEQYRAIIRTFAEQFGLSDEPMIEAMFHTFSDDTSQTLRKLRFDVGPGIARSCIRDAAALKNQGLDNPTAFSYAISGFLLPQFEGALENHDSISNALSSALQLLNASAAQLEAMDRELALYTGFEIGS